MELILIALFVAVSVLPIVAVVWVAKGSKDYRRNVALAELIASTRGPKPVRVGLRLVAFLLDFIVLAIIFGLIAAGINALLGYQDEGVTSPVFIVGWFVYFAGMETVWGATVGKMALRLEVIRADGGRPSLWAALVRSFCKLFGVYTPLGIITTIVCITGSPTAQRFGDRLVGTTVVRRVKKEVGTLQPVAPPAPTWASAHSSSEAGSSALNPDALQADAGLASVASHALRLDDAESQRSGLSSHCAQCGVEFDFPEDRYCPRCGHPRSGETDPTL